MIHFDYKLVSYQLCAACIGLNDVGALTACTRTQNYTAENGFSSAIALLLLDLLSMDLGVVPLAFVAGTSGRSE